MRSGPGKNFEVGISSAKGRSTVHGIYRSMIRQHVKHSGWSKSTNSPFINQHALA